MAMLIQAMMLLKILGKSNSMLWRNLGHTSRELVSYFEWCTINQLQIRKAGWKKKKEGRKEEKGVNFRMGSKKGTKFEVGCKVVCWYNYVKRLGVSHFIAFNNK